MNTQHKLLSSCPVSCFADEIAESLDRQIEVLSRLGISYVELRSADGINVSDFTMNFAKEVKKKLDQANIRISAIGSPIGKIGINDDFDAHLQKLSHTGTDGRHLRNALYPYVQLLYPGKLCCGRLPLRGAFPDGGDDCRGCA